MMSDEKWNVSGSENQDKDSSTAQSVYLLTTVLKSGESLVRGREKEKKKSEELISLLEDFFGEKVRRGRVSSPPFDRSRKYVFVVIFMVGEVVFGGGGGVEKKERRRRLDELCTHARVRNERHLFL